MEDMNDDMGEESSQVIKTEDVNKYYTSKKKKSKRYKQRFRECWLNSEYSSWLRRHPSDTDMALCAYCDRKLTGNISHIKRHASSTLHQKRAEKFNDLTHHYVPSEDEQQHQLEHSNVSSHPYMSIAELPHMQPPHSCGPHIDIPSSHVEVSTTHMNLNSPHIEVIAASNLKVPESNHPHQRHHHITELNSSDIHSPVMEEQHIVEEQASHSTDGNIFQPTTMVHSSKMHDQTEYVVEVCSFCQ